MDLQTILRSAVTQEISRAVSMAAVAWLGISVSRGDSIGASIAAIVIVVGGAILIRLLHTAWGQKYIQPAIDILPALIPIIGNLQQQIDNQMRAHSQVASAVLKIDNAVAAIHQAIPDVQQIAAAIAHAEPTNSDPINKPKPQEPAHA